MKIKLFSVFGVSETGKTTTIENIIRELKSRNYSVGSIKEIHFEDFAIDTPGTDTHRHQQAGSELVTARGYYETDLLYPEELSLEEILEHYDQDYVVIEGVADGNFPKIITARTTEEVDHRLDETVIAISGLIAHKREEYKGLPVIDSRQEIDRLVDLIEEKVFRKLPDFDPDCCTACGFGCRELARKILAGEAKREDCVISDSQVELYVDGEQIKMVPFVQRILRNAVTGVASELDGYQPGAEIKVKLGGGDEG